MVYREVFRLMRVDLETGPFNHYKLIAESQMGLPATIFVVVVDTAALDTLSVSCGCAQNP